VSRTALAAAVGVSERSLFGIEHSEHATLQRKTARLRLGRILAYLRVTSSAPQP
jgi:hypothetical protein